MSDANNNNNNNNNVPPAITLHAPITTGSATASTPAQPPPAPAWLQGKWHVTHSTLPMWRSKRNVSITYTPLPDSTKIDDLVEYQALSNAVASDEKLKSVHGVDTPAPDAAGWAWDWRGKGWLVIASSRWEVLGYGSEDEGGEEHVGGAQAVQAVGEQKRQWVVTYFAKTLFTPAGLDLYSRHEEGLRPQTVAAIREALERVEDEDVRKLAGEIFEVKMDGARTE